jgi:hypothetical protein
MLLRKTLHILGVLIVTWDLLHPFHNKIKEPKILKQSYSEQDEIKHDVF